MQRASNVTRVRWASGQPRTLMHIMQQQTSGERHDCHLESVTSYQKYDSINRCIFIYRTRGTILLNFIPIQFETTEP